MIYTSQHLPLFTKESYRRLKGYLMEMGNEPSLSMAITSYGQKETFLTMAQPHPQDLMPYPASLFNALFL